MGCATKTKSYAKCTIPGTRWVYGYGQYAKSVKDLTVYTGTPQTGYKPANPWWDISATGLKNVVAKAKAYTKDTAAKKILDRVATSATVPVYYIYVAHPGLKNSRVVVEWLYDPKLRAQWFTAMERAFAKIPTDKLRLSFVRDLQTKPPKATSLNALLKALAAGAVQAVKSGLTEETLKKLPNIPPPKISGDSSLSVWPYVVGVALFSAVVLLLYKK